MASRITPQKLFHVLVVGGIALGASHVACSSDSPGDDGGGGGADAKNDAPKADAAAGGDTGVMDAMMAVDTGPCLNKPGDCTHGTCAW